MSAWTKHVTATYRKGKGQNKNFTLKQAMKAASKSWKKVKKMSGLTKKRR